VRPFFPTRLFIVLDFFYNFPPCSDSAALLPPAGFSFFTFFLSSGGARRKLVGIPVFTKISYSTDDFLLMVDLGTRPPPCMAFSPPGRFQWNRIFGRVFSTPGIALRPPVRCKVPLPQAFRSASGFLVDEPPRIVFTLFAAFFFPTGFFFSAPGP